MKLLVTIIGIGCALGVVSSSFISPATTLLRAPEHDSAVIHSERIGGNFAYSTVEGHAYKTIAPIISNVIRPVGVTYYNTIPGYYPGIQHPYFIQYYPQYPSVDTELVDDTNSHESEFEPQVNQEVQFNNDNNSDSVSVESA